MGSFFILVYPPEVSKYSENQHSAEDDQHEPAQECAFDGLMMEHIHAYHGAEKSA